jgi:NAD(P)-dependent dehydrogenase (short-subunit alcohol dehydrogenase family)
MDLGVRGRAFYVSGGTRGVGRAVLELLLAEGASVATCARDGGDLAGLRRELGGIGDQLITEVADVRDASRMAQTVIVALTRFGRLDGVVANAGGGVGGGVLGTPRRTWDDQFTIKMQGALNLVQPAVQALSDSDAGRIVVINGITALRPEPAMAAVSAARAAVANLCRLLAVELAPQRVCVNAVNLGLVLTDRQRERYRESGSVESFDQWCADEAIRRGVLLGRLGTPAEVAPMVALLLSPLSSYITGTAIDIAGGAGA